MQAQGLFFGGGLPASFFAESVCRDGSEFLLQFAPSAPYGFLIQSREEGELLIGGTAGLLGECANKPTALWFVETTEQQIDLMMIRCHCSIGIGLAERATALIDYG